MASTPRNSAELAQALQQLRKDAGLTGEAAAATAGISRYRLMRLEKNMFTPRAAEVEALCRMYRAPAATRRAMLAVVEEVASRPTPARQILYRGGSARMQQRVGRVEESSRLIRVFQPLVVPGLLQTADYARVVLGCRGKVKGSYLDEAVAERMARQAALSDTRKRFVLMMTEGTLRWQAGSARIMADQLAHLAEQASARPHVRVGIIPWDRPVAFFPGHGLSIYDHRTAIIGLWDGTEFVGDPARVALFDDLMGKAERAAVFGDEAAEVIGQGAALYG